MYYRTVGHDLVLALYMYPGPCAEHRKGSGGTWQGSPYVLSQHITWYVNDYTP